MQKILYKGDIVNNVVTAASVAPGSTYSAQPEQVEGVVFTALDTDFSFTIPSTNQYYVEGMSYFVLIKDNGTRRALNFNSLTAINGLTLPVVTLPTAVYVEFRYLNIGGTLGWYCVSCSLPSTSAYDCTIGTGGDYLTFNLAYAAGKSRMRVVGDTSLSADVTLTRNVYVYLDDFTFNCGSFNFTINSGFLLTIEGIGTITFSYSSTKSLFVGNNSVIGKGNVTKTLTITNTSSSNSCQISVKGYYDNLIVNLPNVNFTGWGAVSNTFDGTINNCTINSGGSNCDILLGTTNTTKVSKLTIVGNFRNFNAYTADSIIATGTGVIAVYHGTNIYSGGTLRAINSITNFICSAIDQNNSSQKFVNGVVTGAYSSTVPNELVFQGVTFNSTVSVSTDNNRFNNCRVDGLFTLSSGAENNFIGNNRLYGGLTDNSGNNTNIILGNI